MRSLDFGVIRVLLLGLGIALAIPPLQAQTFSDKPITLICPWPAGGTTDIALRALAEAMAKNLGQRVVVAGLKGMDPKVVKVLHDAIKKAIDDPVYLKVAERLDQERWYLGSDDYARYAREFYPTQKMVMEKLGLKQ